MFCKNCGKQIEMGATKCQYCGFSVVNDTTNNTLNVNTSVNESMNSGLNVIPGMNADNSSNTNEGLMFNNPMQPVNSTMNNPLDASTSVGGSMNGGLNVIPGMNTDNSSNTNEGLMFNNPTQPVNSTMNNPLDANTSVGGSMNGGLNVIPGMNADNSSNTNEGLMFNNPMQPVNSTMNNPLDDNTSVGGGMNNGMNLDNNMQQNLVGQTNNNPTNGKKNNKFGIIVIVLGIVIVGLVALIIYKNLGNSNENNGNDIVDNNNNNNNNNSDNINNGNSSNYILYQGVNYYVPNGWIYNDSKDIFMMTNDSNSPTWVLGELIGYDSFDVYRNEDSKYMFNAYECANASYNEKKITNREAISIYYDGCNSNKVKAYEIKMIKINSYKMYMMAIIYYDNKQFDNYVEDIASKTLSYNNFSANDNDVNGTEGNIKDLITKENIDKLLEK